MSKSLVWQYYERGRADDNRKIGTCRLCETKIKCSQSSTSGLLDSFAEIEYEDRESDVESSESELESASDAGDELKEGEDRIASVAEDSDSDSD